MRTRDSDYSAPPPKRILSIVSSDNHVTTWEGDVVTDADERIAKALVHGTILVLIGDVLGVGGSFLTRLVAARHLGPGEYGVVVLGLTFVNVLATLSLMGLPEGVARQLPRLDDSMGAIRGPIVAVVSIGITISLFLGFQAEAIASLFDEPGLEPVLVIFAATLPVVVIVRLLVGAFRGMEAVGLRVLIQNVLYQAGAAIAVLVGVFHGVGAVGIAASWLVAATAAAVVGTYAVHANFDLLRGGASTEMPLGQTIAFSLPLMVSHGLWMLVEQSDSLVLGYFSQASAVGVYDASFTIARMLLVLNSAASFLILPVFSRLHDDGNAAAIREQYRLVTKTIVVVAVPAYCVVVVAPDLVLTTVFGEQYVAGTVLAVVATGFFTHVATGVNGNALIAIGRTHTVMWGNLYCLIVNLVLNVILVPVFGPLGAAAASALSYAIATGYWGYHLYRETGIPPLYPGVAKALVLVTATFFLLVPVFRSRTGSSITEGVALAGLFAVVYLIVISTVFNGRELDLLRRQILIRI